MMLNLIITGLFLISVAIAAGSIIIVSQLRTKYQLGTFSILLYMLVFYFMFGFYALWGQLIVVSYVTTLVEKPILDKIHEISVLLGSPFIVFGWLMFLKFFNEFIGLKPLKFFNATFLTVNFVFLVAVGFWNSKTENLIALDILKFYFIVSNSIYCLYASFLLIKSSRDQLPKLNEKMNFAYGIILFMLAQNVTLFIYDSNIWIALVFIFLFFSGTAFIPLFLKYNTELPDKILTDIPKIYSFESFCIKYEISPREKEIIREICNGLSNQQIADRLFISLQTVKDHTHRIYGKTMASSRMQLMKMVQEVSR